MSHFQVNAKCNGCLACVQNCPANALSYVDKGQKRTILHNIILCARCGNCWRVCPQQAVEFQHLLKGDWQEVVTTDLIRCSVCGDPVYTEGVGRSMTDKLRRDVQPLCPRHRSTVSLAGWLRATRVGVARKEDKNDRRRAQTA
jgi:ferredoxin